MAQVICAALFSKIDEQIERASHLIGLLPENQLNWSPADNNMSAGALLGHLLECLAGFCAVLYAADPDHLQHFSGLRRLQVNHVCGKDEARQRIQLYRAHIDQGFTLLQDGGLGMKLPTIFVSDGESLMTLLLGNLEHLINHKHQLFTYLKLMGVDVSSKDLYRF